MPVDKRRELAQALHDFVDRQACRGKRPLREWQRILGWANWGLNAYPLLKPALQSSYAKITGKKHALAAVPLNGRVVQDLAWMADRIMHCEGINVLQTKIWSLDEADIELYTDASASGLAFWTPTLDIAYVSSIMPGDARYGDIFFNEALAVVSALSWTTTLTSPPRRILIHTDSMNTVDIFHSLSAKSEYNTILLFAVEILMDCNVDLRVIHIPGERNTIADALSRSLFDVAYTLAPNLRIHPFTPPRDELGANAI